jgi:predicted nucleic-acid-binding Zn-ribbon protein
VTGPELIARLYAGQEPRPPKLYSRGRRHRCPGCGCRGDCWRVEQVGVSAPTTSSGELSRVQRAHFRVTWTCHTCGHEDVEQRPEQLAEVPVSGLVG